MAESLEILAGIEDQVAKARRLAIETRDAAAAARLRQIADDLEQYVQATLPAISLATASRAPTLDS